MLDEKPQPHSKEAEEAVLGSCLIDNLAIPVVAAVLEPEDFYDEAHGRLFGHMLALHQQGVAVDDLTLLDRMNGDGDPAALTWLTNATPTSLHAEHYARIVARKATRRRLIGAAGQVAKLAWDEENDLDEAQDEAAKVVLETRGRDRRDARPLGQLVRAYYDRIEILARGNRPLGLPTGYMDVDAILGGMHPKDLVILAARPGMGKTAFALNVALKLSKMGQRVGFWTLEMSDEQIVQRLFSLDSAVPTVNLRTGKLEAEEWPAFMKATDTLDKLPIWVDDSPGITPDYLRAGAMRLQAVEGLDLVVVDYLQLMRAGGKGRKRYEEITEVSQALKGIAKDLGVPVLALSQLSRACESRMDKRPQLSDLRESGALEQDANAVLFLYRDEMYNENTETPNIAEVHVAKNRDGPTGTCSLYFRKHLMEFLDATVRYSHVEDAYEQHYANGL